MFFLMFARKDVRTSAVTALDRRPDIRFGIPVRSARLELYQHHHGGSIKLAVTASLMELEMFSGLFSGILVSTR